MVVKLVKAEEVQKYIRDYGHGAIEDGKATLDPVDDIVAISGILDLMPGVDAEEVVHLAWDTVEKTQTDGLMYFTHRCPRCNGSHSDLRKESIYSWCPHCGAKMDRGVQND